MLLGSLGVGLTLSAICWAVLDSLHRWTGIQNPDWWIENLYDRLGAFYAIVLSRYRCYQFYDRMFFAVPIWVVCHVSSAGPNASVAVVVIAGLALVARKGWGAARMARSQAAPPTRA